MENTKIGYAMLERLKSVGEPIGKKDRAFFLPRAEGRRIAISDIHGCFETFCRLLEKVDLQKKDQLFLLGDYVDRGPYSRLVLRKIFQLLQDGYFLVALRGNHEQLLMDFHGAGSRKLGLFAERQNALHLVKNGTQLRSGLHDFFDSLPYYIETDKHLLVHGGFDPEAKKPLKSWHDMLWIRRFEYSKEIFREKRIVHGHVPTEWKRIKSAVRSGAPVWPIDNACVRAGHSGYGRLIAVDLDSGELWKCKNRDSRRVY